MRFIIELLNLLGNYKKRCVLISLSYTIMISPMQHPFSCIIGGPSKAGKSQFTLKLIQNVNSIVEPPPQEIVWCYSIFQKVFESIKNVHFIEGLPNISEFDGSKRVLLIIDDLMQHVNESVEKIFTRDSHHKNISVIFITQNIFHSSKHNRTMNLNAQYLVLFKNPRDVGQISHLSRQMYPGQGKFLVEAFKNATNVSYGYLFLDLSPKTDENLRVRTNIFPNEINYVYLPK